MKLWQLAPLALVGCTGNGELGGTLACDPDGEEERTASCIEELSLGPGAGFGALDFPNVIFGEPRGGGVSKGSTDVLSLGRGGVVTVGFDGGVISNGPGPDFLVFENPFAIGGDITHPFKELGEVSVSEDGENWVTFVCTQDTYPFTGCAGWNPVLAGSDPTIDSFNPDEAGGDPFDLADVGLESARFVRIRDISNAGDAGTAGFDLDAVAIINIAPPSRTE
ncbi:MAG: hypothetical protein IPK82_36545 [Polyangiaceae bacterium]|nr:hypothetical protein [Polyangiaceae bacterium]